MKHCQRCNLEFPVSFKFCGACGGSLSESFYCLGCGDLIETKWAFCTNCGKKVASDETGEQEFSVDVPDLTKVPEPASLPSLNPRSFAKTAHASEQQEKNASNHEWYTASDLFEETSEMTAIPGSLKSPKPNFGITPSRVTQPQSSNGKAAPTLTMLSAYGVTETTAPPVWQVRRKLPAVLLLLVFFGVLGFGGVYWWTHWASAAQTPVSTETSTGPEATDSSSLTSSTSGATKPVEQIIARDTADQEWQRLREGRINAKPSEANQIITSFKEAEKKYPHDYRFPYERAKLSIKGITSHHEAFEALSAAADKAIESGKAQEMLDSLEADKEGDFWKLSRGHHEWLALEEALQNKSKTRLKTLHH